MAITWYFKDKIFLFFRYIDYHGIFFIVKTAIKKLYMKIENHCYSNEIESMRSFVCLFLFVCFRHLLKESNSNMEHDNLDYLDGENSAYPKFLNNILIWLLAKRMAVAMEFSKVRISDTHISLATTFLLLYNLKV